MTETAELTKDDVTDEQCIYSLDAYAEETALDRLWLYNEFKLRDGKDKDGTGYIKIPYFDVNGTEINYRKRYAPLESSGSARFSWGSGPKGKIYGLERLGQFKKSEFVVIVDNEKDVHTLRRYEVPAIAIPDAKAVKNELTEALQRITPYIHAAQGALGESFAYAIKDILSHNGYKDIIYWFTTADFDVTDINGLYKKIGNERFRYSVMELVIKAHQFDLPDSSGDHSVDDRDAELAAYYEKAGYFVRGGRLCMKKEDESMTPIAKFVPIPLAEIMKDDGISDSPEILYRFGGYKDGSSLHEITISAIDAAKGLWEKKWGSAAVIVPKKGEYFYRAVQEAIYYCRKQEYIYTYMGIKTISGKDVYLHSAGLIGEAKEAITVEMRAGLEDYIFTDRKISYAEAIKTDIAFLNIAKWQITIPLLAMTYLSPLIEFLDRIGIKPSFAMFLYGKTGSYKSSTTAAAMWHFGTFKYNRFPGSFNDTSSGAERGMFDVKDALYILDDYHPESRKDAERMNAFAERVIQGIGNNAGRNRMNSDRTVVAGFRPRCGVVMTGEFLPPLKQSTMARIISIEVLEGDVDLKSVIELEQDWWKLNIAMQGYIKYILKNADRLLQGDLASRFEGYQQEFIKSSEHMRQASAAAWLMVGFGMFLEYAASAGYEDQSYMAVLAAEAKQIILNLIEINNIAIVNENPGRIYIDTLTEMLRTGDCWVKDIDGSDDPTAQPPALPMKQFIGYEDTNYYYLIPGTAYKAVSDFYHGNFTVDDKTVRKRLRDDGIIVVDDKNSNLTKRKWRKDGSSPRYLWIKKAKIDGYLSDDFVKSGEIKEII